MRYSKQREMILQVVAENKIHPTAEQVYELVRKHNPTISLGTVYRDLNQLAEAEKLLRLRIGGSKDRFDANICAHYHVKCSKCGRFKDLPEALNKNVTQLLLQINQTTDMHISPTCIQFEGLCETCKEEERKKMKQNEEGKGEKK